MGMIYPRIFRGLHRRWAHWQNNRHIRKLAAQVVSQSPQPLPGTKPVLFFNASTRLGGLSLNAAYALIAGWGLRLAGVPVVNFACHSGMSRCILGTNRLQPQVSPPCASCIGQSRVLFHQQETKWFTFQADPKMETHLQSMTLAEMTRFEYQGVPLGELVLPGARWVLRRHHLVDNESTRFLFRQFLLSAWNVAQSFREFLLQVNPQAVVVFNGIAFPEATVRWVARQKGIRVITHEVCHQPFTAFFHPGDATAYPISVPEDFELDEKMNERLDRYLEQRFKGNFSMAGIRFWREIRHLDQAFINKLSGFKQVVPVFTNVIFDTSQGHANVVFAHMFEWLDLILSVIRNHPETLFVIRAHPDEARPGKESQESVEEWVRTRQVDRLPNVVFVSPGEYFSSYELIQRSKFVMVYNSTIGIEAALMGAAVLCGGRSRYTQLPMVYFPSSPQEYHRMAEDFLSADKVEVPAEFVRNARRFMYINLYRACLPFASFIEEDGSWAGYVKLKPFSPADLLQSPTIQAIVRGILDDKPFLIEG